MRSAGSRPAAARQLYTDADETLLNVTRPILLNGIENMVSRPDLGERSIIITLKPIDEVQRMNEDDLWAAFEAERPKIFGALLDAVSAGLRYRSSVNLARRPRLADFATWITAAEPALGWEPGSFLDIYDKNQGQAVEEVLQADPVSAAVVEFMADKQEWRGSATELLHILGRQVGERVQKGKGWPATASTLSNKLKRAATFLRRTGIDYEDRREGKRRHRVTILTAGVRKTPSAPSAPSALLKNQGVKADGQAMADGPMENAVRPKPLKDKTADGADAADGLSPTTLAAEDARVDREERAAIQEFDGDGAAEFDLTIPPFLDRRFMSASST